MGTVDDVLVDVQAVVADMQEFIDRCRSHGDNWEAELVEGYRDPLVDIIKRYAPGATTPLTHHKESDHD